MADFCNQCAAELDLPPYDLAGITLPHIWLRNAANVVICEGCGVIQVDPQGNCVSKDCLKGGHVATSRTNKTQGSNRTAGPQS